MSPENPTEHIVPLPALETLYAPFNHFMAEIFLADPDLAVFYMKERWLKNTPDSLWLLDEAIFSLAPYRDILDDLAQRAGIPLEYIQHTLTSPPRPYAGEEDE